MQEIHLVLTNGNKPGEASVTGYFVNEK